MLDTVDFYGMGHYGMGHNELLIGRALRGRHRDGAQCQFRGPAWPGRGLLGVGGRPAAVKTAVAYTLTRLGTDHADIYRLARLDPDVPIEDSVGTIADLGQAGPVQASGLLGVGADSIRRAHAVHAISDVQIEYSLVSRGVEEETLSTCRELA